MEDITDTDYNHTKRACKDFAIKYLDEDIIICMLKVIHYCYLVYLTTFGICVLKYMNLILLIFFPHQNKHGTQPHLQEEQSKIRSIN